MILLHQLLLQRAAVDPHSNGNIPLFRHRHHCGNLVTASDIARIDADLVRPVLHGRDRHLIVKMNIRHQRNVYLLLNLLHRRCRRQSRHRTADDLTSGLLQPQNLLHRRLHIFCLRVRHGLDHDRIPASDHSISNFPMHIIFLSVLLFN